MKKSDDEGEFKKRMKVRAENGALRLLPVIYDRDIDEAKKDFEKLDLFQDYWYYIENPQTHDAERIQEFIIKFKKWFGKPCANIMSEYY